MTEDIAIWGGRWQPPHLGHEWVFKHVLTQYQSICIAIVNPDPDRPPVESHLFPRFERELNPLSFFERQILWRRIALDANAAARVIIVPTWHPRKEIVLENSFFPPHSKRIWIVPMQADEELMKVRDFKQLGERTSSNIAIPLDVLGISGSDIRMRMSNGASWLEMLPESIREFGPSVLTGGVNENCGVVIPVLNDHPHPWQFAHAKALAENGIIPVFALGVDIEDSPNWWFRPERNTRILSYYERYCLIARVGALLELNQPFVVPLFLTPDGNTVAYESFLPRMSTRTWALSGTNQDSGELVSLLVKNGESLEFVGDYDIPSAQKAEAAIKNELTRVYYGVRAAQRKNRSKKEMSGINFGDGAVIHGNVVGGEATVGGDVQSLQGEQINISQLDAVKVRAAVTEFLKTALNGSDSDLELNSTGLIDRTKQLEVEEMKLLVRQAVEEFLREQGKERGRLRERIESFAISASSSGAVSAVIEALRIVGGG